MRQTHREEIRVPGMPEPISHFTHVVRAGRTVFVSGCVASDENGKTVGGADIVAQTRQVHENIKRCLAAAGASFADVCKVTVFLRNVGDREKVNSVRKEYFGAHRPASTLIEIEAIAVLPEPAERGRSRTATALRLRTATPGSRAPLQKSPRHAPPKKRR
jgi:2-iminobutanoate/2-iminopropanoate deaminase